MKRRDLLTRAEFDAIFEVGGRQAAWDAVQAEHCVIAANAVRDYQQKQPRRKFSVDWDLVGMIAFACCLLACLVVPIYLSVSAGASELDDCKHGRTLGCQEGVQGAENMSRRTALYRTAYKQATGKDLPPMESDK